MDQSFGYHVLQNILTFFYVKNFRFGKCIKIQVLNLIRIFEKLYLLTSQKLHRPEGYSCCHFHIFFLLSFKNRNKNNFNYLKNEFDSVFCFE